MRKDHLAGTATEAIALHKRKELYGAADLKFTAALGAAIRGSTTASPLCGRLTL
jgi:hypothetical protein